MKKSELKQIIKEEIHKVLNENIVGDLSTIDSGDNVTLYLLNKYPTLKSSVLNGYGMYMDFPMDTLQQTLNLDVSQLKQVVKSINSNLENGGMNIVKDKGVNYVRIYPVPSSLFSGGRLKDKSIKNI
jgi:predicted component of type VI protein secretion system